MLINVPEQVKEFMTTASKNNVKMILVESGGVNFHDPDIIYSRSVDV